MHTKLMISRSIYYLRMMHFNNFYLLQTRIERTLFFRGMYTKKYTYVGTYYINSKTDCRRNKKKKKSSIFLTASCSPSLRCRFLLTIYTIVFEKYRPVSGKKERGKKKRSHLRVLVRFLNFSPRVRFTLLFFRFFILFSIVAESWKWNFLTLDIVNLQCFIGSAQKSRHKERHRCSRLIQALRVCCCLNLNFLFFSLPPSFSTPLDFRYRHSIYYNYE